MIVPKRILVTPASLCADRDLLSPLAAFHSIEYSAQHLPSDLDRYSALILGNETFDRESFRAARNLRIIVRYGVTFHNVDLRAAADHNVVVTHCPQIATTSVSEYVLATSLLMIKQLNHVNKRPSRELTEFKFADFSNKSFGVIGLGNIGERVARTMQALGLRVLIYNRSDKSPTCDKLGVTQTTLERVLQYSDIVSVHLTLNDETRGLMGHGQFKHMRAGALFINTSQAGLVDPAALAVALESGHLGGVVSDFTYPGFDLAAYPNSFVTPHISSRSILSTTQKVALVVDTIRDYFNGSKPPLPNQINPA
ncbi:NAD(P)-dependent oxidoreductase [Bosea vaviloviae]|uniref:NAD(P)-dependent oxidoreductase n=1 Tax=Bosea vaviloviae TaxID=1526658 RepID=UPI0013141FCE|nr:NAD(P)-dependent oxidoreductase [Bosea vaviloviae]